MHDALDRQDSIKNIFWNKLFLNLINVLNEQVVNYVDKSTGKKPALK